MFARRCWFSGDSHEKILNHRRIWPLALQKEKKKNKVHSNVDNDNNNNKPSDLLQQAAPSIAVLKVNARQKHRNYHQQFVQLHRCNLRAQIHPNASELSLSERAQVHMICAPRRRVRLRCAGGLLRTAPGDPHWPSPLIGQWLPVKVAVTRGVGSVFFGWDHEVFSSFAWPLKQVVEGSRKCVSCNN